ncbi:MAG: lysophospholipid acyltransferase family protein [Acidobacteriota bacterium]|nr:lysophospholipid acyltransferase family protein [Acidobacteriota bacterium]
MQQKKGSFKSRLELALFTGTLSLVKISPPWALRLEKKLLVFFLKKGSPRHSHLITHNLALAFPDAGAAQRAALKNRIYDHFGSMFMEIARAFVRSDKRSVLSRARVNHAEVLERALKKGRGVIVFSAHFGNWEWIPLILRDRLGREIHSIARPMDNPLIERRVLEFREAMGSRVIYKQGSLRTILKRLAANEVVYLLIDQNTVPREGVFVDFFANKAAAVTTVAQLYLKKHVPVVPVFLHYEGEAIVLDVLPEVDFPAGNSGPAAVCELTQELTRIIEGQVRKFPEQWFWFHDRWKTRPQGEAK